MPISVEIEGKGVVAEFPDGTDPTVIDAAIKRDFFSQQPTQKTPTFMESLKSMPIINEPGVGLGEVTEAAPKALARELAPHAPMAGMIIGQAVARGNPIGAVLGYAAGKQAQPLAEAYGEDSPLPSGLEMGRKAIMEDLPEGTIAQVIGGAATKTIEGLIKASGAVIAARCACRGRSARRSVTTAS